MGFLFSDEASFPLLSVVALPVRIIELAEPFTSLFMFVSWHKSDYMRMSIAEKVRCYPLDDKGTDAVFEMVRTYFEKIGMEISFDSVYEETKLLTDYYEKQKVEEFIAETAERVIETMKLFELILVELQSIQQMYYLKCLALEIWSILPELNCLIM